VWAEGPPPAGSRPSPPGGLDPASRAGLGATSRAERHPRLDDTDDDLPSLAMRRDRLVEAGEALLTYAEAVWATARRFFRSIAVLISDERREGKMRTRVWPGGPPTAPPRAQRDPGPFLRRRDD
jgi:hypothetical protein